MNPNYLDLLPDEMILKLLAETDDLETLHKWRQTSRRINNICQDEGLWKEKYLEDFGIESELMEGETWRKQYKQRTMVGINSPISGMYYHYGIIDQKGILYMAGENVYGQLGNGTTIRLYKPVVIPFKQKIIGISCSMHYTAALTEDGKIYIWGDLSRLDGIDGFITGIERDRGNQRKNILTPRLFNFPHPVIKIHARIQSLGIITADLIPYFTGYMKPINIKAIDIASTTDKYAIISTDRKLYIWGNSDQPKHIPLPELVKQISFGKDHYAVLSINGNVYIWGSNEYGKLGVNLGLPFEEIVRKATLLGQHSHEILRVPTKLDLLSPISFISMGAHTSAILTTDGKLYMWGANNDGKILNEDRDHSWVNPIFKPARYNDNYVTNLMQISIEGQVINYVVVGSLYTLAMTDDGVINYWGSIPGWSPE